jgi:hypothetical protein
MQETNEIQKQIERFISYFQNKYQIIKETKFKENDELLKKILYVGIIDSFSKTIFPRKGNRERFVSFLEKYSEWKHSNRISLPHLVRLLEFTPEPEYSKLREFVFSAYGQWPSGEIISLEKDPEFKEVIKYWPKGQANNECIKGVKLEALKHVHLFYTYRNSLIHELRNLGYGLEELSLGKEPSYHSMIMEDGKDTWQLVYPLGFFENICETCIINLKEYLILNNIDPYNSFKFGSYWKEELNQ